MDREYSQVFASWRLLDMKDTFPSVSASCVLCFGIVVSPVLVELRQLMLILLIWLVAGSGPFSLLKIFGLGLCEPLPSSEVEVIFDADMK